MYLMLFVLLSCVLKEGAASGVMLMYRPRDVSNECFSSQHLYYDLTFGMGMSDTITLVFRTRLMNDYDCTVDVVTDPGIYILMVVMYPNLVKENCRQNRGAFTLVNNGTCVYFCDLMEPTEMKHKYYKEILKERLSLWFRSNSSINTNMNTNLYQVTFTAARLITHDRCNPKNECICGMRSRKFCFTSGVVCDGIKNCGEQDWYDERRSDCQIPSEQMNFSAMIAVAAVLFLAVLGGTHFLLRCLPPLSRSFFIFNTNEDNRLYIDPLLQPPPKEPEYLKNRDRRKSIIPVYLSSSEEDSSKDEESAINDELVCLKLAANSQAEVEPAENESRRTTRIKVMTNRLQNKFRAVAGRPPLDHHQADQEQLPSYT